VLEKKPEINMKNQVVIDLDSDENPEEPKTKAPRLQIQNL
jgi:hypothetical protein